MKLKVNLGINHIQRLQKQKKKLKKSFFSEKNLINK